MFEALLWLDSHLNATQSTYLTSTNEVRLCDVVIFVTVVQLKSAQQCFDTDAYIHLNRWYNSMLLYFG